MINVRDFGAIGDGNPHDSNVNSINSAASKAMDLGEALYFPGGSYYLDSRLEFWGRSGKPLYLVGDGKALTRLVWTSNQGGILFSGKGTSANDITGFSIEKITLATKVEGGGTALRLEWAEPESHMNANPQKKIRIHDIEIRGFDSYGGNTQGWQYGIWITNPGGLDISHVDILGKAGISESGIKCDAQQGSIAIRHFLSNIYVLWHRKGIEFNGSIEGVYFNNFEIVGCLIGLVANDSGNVYHISNGHTDCRMTGMEFNSHAEVKVHNVAFYHTPNGGNKMDGTLLELKECSRIAVTGCSFYGFKTDPIITHQNGILVAGCISGVLVGNQFDQIKDAAILFGEKTMDCHSVANRATNCGVRYTNNGAPSNTDDDPQD
ncbi:MAG TPA: glycosyl hydrolase family 28-related protein [Methanothrix sp.]|nr:glycosyl hydrolase family 28-related protein [Methanothrix sp.]